MRVTCQHCSKVLQIPDEKAPPVPFQLTCPGCKQAFVVAGESPGAVPAPADSAAASAAAPAAAPDGGEMPALRPAERELLSSMVPEAYVVDLGQSPLRSLKPDLESLGMQEVRSFGSLEEAIEMLSDTGAGILIIRIDKASAPPCAPLEPLEKLSFAERRRTFVVLVAENVKSLDGQVAFYLQVNCLIQTRDLDRFDMMVRRALLYHLRLYRHWTIDTVS